METYFEIEKLENTIKNKLFYKKSIIQNICSADLAESVLKWKSSILVKLRECNLQIFVKFDSFTDVFELILYIYMYIYIYIYMYIYIYLGADLEGVT